MPRLKRGAWRQKKSSIMLRNKRQKIGNEIHTISPSMSPDDPKSKEKNDTIFDYDPRKRRSTLMKEI